MKVFADISIWWLIPWAVISIAIAWLFYRNQKGLKDAPAWLKLILGALRAGVVFVLGTLLFGLLFQTKEEQTQKPVFITVLDSSSSMLNYKDSSVVKSKIQKIRSSIQEQLGERMDFVDFSVSSEFSKDLNYEFRGEGSDLYEGFEQVYSRYYNQNIGGILFVSDGNFNVGQNPSYAAEKISLTPIFTIGVGDTVQKRDQLIRNVSANDVAFFKNEFPIEVDVEAARLSGISSELSIWKDGQKLQSQEIRYDNKLDFKHVSFLMEAKQVGFVQYTIKLEDQDNESSYANNEWTVYVEIIDSRNKILMLSAAPHPDVSAIKSVLDRDENVQVESVLVNEFDGTFDEYQMVVWHEPGQNLQSGLNDRLKASRTPVLYLIGGGSSKANVESLNIGLNKPNGRRTDEAQAKVDPGFQLFELEEDTKKTIESWPPLVVPFGGVEQRGGSTLLKQQIGPVTKKDPVMYFGDNGQSKIGVIVGEGLWKWKLSEYQRTKRNIAFNELLQKTTQYLVVKKNTDALRVNMPRRFNVREDIIINAEFYNSAFEKITEPNIDFVITNKETGESNYSFGKQSTDYRLVLGKLKGGQYNWTCLLYTSPSPRDA